MYVEFRALSVTLADLQQNRNASNDILQVKIK
jgi:hypothetical protein